MDKFMYMLRNGLTFEWLAGYRTTLIALFVLMGWLVEYMNWYDIPGVDFGIEEVLLALGLKTASLHK